MTRKRANLLSVLAITAVAATTLVAVLRGTHMDEQYGMAKIKLAHETVYVKARTCAHGCSASPWISRSSDRCKAPDAAEDYTLHTGELLYAPEGDTLVIADASRAVTSPARGDWINMRFVPAFGGATDMLPLREIVFGEHLPTRAVPTEAVELGPCVRAFGHDWF